MTKKQLMSELTKLNVDFKKSWSKKKLEEVFLFVEPNNSAVVKTTLENGSKKDYALFADLKVNRMINEVKRLNLHKMTSTQLEALAMERAKADLEQGLFEKHELNKKASGKLWYLNECLAVSKSVEEACEYYEEEYQLSDMPNKADRRKLISSKAESLWK